MTMTSTCGPMAATPRMVSAGTLTEPRTSNQPRSAMARYCTDTPAADPEQVMAAMVSTTTADTIGQKVKAN